MTGRADDGGRAQRSTWVAAVGDRPVPDGKNPHLGSVGPHRVQDPEGADAQRADATQAAAEGVARVRVGLEQGQRVEGSLIEGRG